VRKYLSEFLSDPRVLDIPWFSRFLLLQGIILPFRSYRSAKAYQKVWTEEGSPLLVHSRAYEKKLQDALGLEFRVVLGMRYGEPSLKQAWDSLKDSDCSQIVIFPLYPHYASSSTGSALEEVYRLAKKEWNVPPMKSVEPFFNKGFFIKTLREHIAKELEKIKWEHVVFSFHGLPQHHIEKSGCEGSCEKHACAAPYCYRAQCFETVRLLNIDGEHSCAFQSRLGRRPWIQPYFDEQLVVLRKKGIKHLAVVCPSFVSDCLETVEEIRIRARETWKKLGGESLTLIPCLNDSDAWVQACVERLKLVSMIEA
jgi:ferrochelatase